MPMIVTLDDDLVAELKDWAKRQQLSVEALVIRILTDAVVSSEPVTLREVVARIQSTPPNPAQIRPATADLADLLQAAPGDSCFDLEAWKHQWSAVEAEMRAITRANDNAESRNQSS